MWLLDPLSAEETAEASRKCEVCRMWHSRALPAHHVLLEITLVAMGNCGSLLSCWGFSVVRYRLLTKAGDACHLEICSFRCFFNDGELVHLQSIGSEVVTLYLSCVKCFWVTFISHSVNVWFVLYRITLSLILTPSVVYLSKQLCPIPIYLAHFTVWSAASVLWSHVSRPWSISNLVSKAPVQLVFH